MKPHIHKTKYTLDTIRVPQHPLISIIWKAFENINFSVPATDWINPTLLSTFYFPAITLWRPVPHAKLELLTGFRAYNLAITTGLTEIFATETSPLNEAEALEMAINDVLLPLLIWSNGNISSNKQIFEFCKNIRKNLPESYRKRLPRQTQLCHWLQIGEYVGRKQPVTTSQLAKLRIALTSAAASENESQVNHDQN